MYYKTPNAQTESLQSQDNSPQSETSHEADYQKLLQAFEALALIRDPIKFPVEFELSQRKSGLRLTTFKAAYRAWVTQQERGGQE